MKKEIEGFDYIISDEEKIIGIVTETRRKYNLYLKPNGKTINTN